MPRANRYFLPGHVWQKEFLLKFVKDREAWLHWLFEARKRYGLCVLNYMVTSNHIHLLVKDTGKDVIPHSMQLIAGRTAQAYNKRKHHQGAFWEDRYHATAVQSDEHFLRCLVYIDLNMVRAGVVCHPSKWVHCGYHEIQQPSERYRIIDQASLLSFSPALTFEQLRSLHLDWIMEELKRDRSCDDRWTQSVVVGQCDYIEQVQTELKERVLGHECIETDDGWQLKEPSVLYATKQG